MYGVRIRRPVESSGAPMMLSGIMVVRKPRRMTQQDVADDLNIKMTSYDGIIQSNDVI